MGSDRKNFPAGDSHADVSNKLCHHLHQEKEATNRERAEAELNAALPARAGELEKAAADIIKTEAQSEH